MPWLWPFRARPEQRNAGDVRAEAVTAEIDRALERVKKATAEIAEATAQIVERRTNGGHPGA